MTSCPYTTHQTRFDVSPGYHLVSYCREGCGHTFFICPSCQEANRPLARYCRNCGESILFQDAHAQQEVVQPLKEGRRENYKLTDLGGTEVQALKTYKGFLIVVTDRIVLLYDIHKIYEPLFQFRPSDGRIVRGVTLVASEEDEKLLVTTSRNIYSVSLLNMQPDNTSLYEAGAGRYITQPVVYCAGQLYTLELDERTQTSRLVRLTEGDLLSFDGTVRSLLNLTGDRFFFSTQNRVFLYSGGRVLQQQLSEELAEADAAYSQDLEAIYLVGENGLWRLSVSGEELMPVSLPARVTSAARITARGDCIFVSHPRGFLVLDPFGTVRWDSEQHFIRAESDGLNPQTTEQYVLFTARALNGGSDVRIHTLNNWNDFKTHTYEERLLCPPLLTMGRLLSVTGGTGAPSLVCAT